MAYEKEIDEGRDWDNEDDERIYDQMQKEQDEFEEFDLSFVRPWRPVVTIDPNWEELNQK